MEPLPYSKYSGCGNDFVLFDFRKKEPTLNVPRICDRKQGIGADGVILLQNSSIADFRMRIFNADGSEAEMCGNGIRCLAKYLIDIGIEAKPVSIEVMQEIYHVEAKDDGQVALEMQLPKTIEWNVRLDEKIVADYIDIGVPHAVLFVSDLEQEELMSQAPAIRHHKAFGPRGCNVNFAQIKENQVHLRTYERGVEGETLACGTGAAATAIAAMKHFQVPSPLVIIPRSKIPIEMAIRWENGSIKQITQIGPAELVCSGPFVLN